MRNWTDLDNSFHFQWRGNLNVQDVTQWSTDRLLESQKTIHGITFLYIIRSPTNIFCVDYIWFTVQNEYILAKMNNNSRHMAHLTHRCRVMHICISTITIIILENGLSPGRHQAIIWTNAGILLISTIWTNFNEILSEIFSFNKMGLKMSSGTWWQFGLSLKTLNNNICRRFVTFCYILADVGTSLIPPSYIIYVDNWSG